MIGSRQEIRERVRFHLRERTANKYLDAELDKLINSAVLRICTVSGPNRINAYRGTYYISTVVDQASYTLPTRSYDSLPSISRIIKVYGLDSVNNKYIPIYTFTKQDYDRMNEFKYSDAYDYFEVEIYPSYLQRVYIESDKKTIVFDPAFEEAVDNKIKIDYWGVPEYMSTDGGIVNFQPNIAELVAYETAEEAYIGDPFTQIIQTISRKKSELLASIIESSKEGFLDNVTPGFDEVVGSFATEDDTDWD